MRGEQLTMDEHLDLEGNDLRDEHAKVLQFHARFGLPRPAVPQHLTEELARFRIGFMQEELDEFQKAYQDGDLEKCFDALLDLNYVVLGTAIMMGLPWYEGFEEVHRANMTKVRARRSGDSKRGTTYDVVKPQGWQPPDLQGVLEEHAEEVEAKITAKNHDEEAVQ